MICGTCGRRLDTNPNERENVVPCRMCTAVFCSDACLLEHQEAAHRDQIAVVPDEDEPA